MEINCETTKNAQEIQLCSCKLAAETYKKLYEEYTKKRAQYAVDSASYQRWRDIHNQWKNKTGEFEKWNAILGSKDLTFFKELWAGGQRGWYNDCQDRVNNENYNWQCGNSAAVPSKNIYDPWGFYAYETPTARGAGPCRWLEARCKRRDDSKAKIDNDYNAVEPRVDPKTNRVWLHVSAPTDDARPPSYTGVCCSQIFEDIQVDGGDVSINDIQQKCGISTTTTTTAGEPEKTTTTATTDTLETAAKSATDDSGTSGDSGDSGDSGSKEADATDSWIMILIIVLLVLLCMSSGVSAIFMITSMMSKGVKK